MQYSNALARALEILDIGIEYDEEIDPGADKGSFKTVGDVEHRDLIEKYAADNSMKDIANRMNRSPATVSNQVKDHNERVEKSGFCARCRRAGGEFFDIKIWKGGPVE